MGATAAIGAGVQVIGGIASHNQKNKQARAEKAAIASQQKINKLNSDLQLLELENQQNMSQRQSLLQKAVEDEAYLNRQFQLDAVQLQNASAMTQAEIDARLSMQQAQVNQAAGEQRALEQRTSADTAAVQALGKAIGASTQEVQQVTNAFAQRPEKERQRLISNLMDLGAMEDGENLALQMLNELADNGEMGKTQQAIALNDARIDNADALKEASLAENEQRQAIGNTSASIQNEGQQYQAKTGLLDVSTARSTNQAADAAERIALDSAYLSNQASRQLQEQARDVTYAANKDVLEQGAKLSDDAMNAQRKAISGSGFLDVLAIGGQGYNTYRSLGGGFGFLNNRTNSNGVLTDVTNVNANVG